MDKKIHVLHAAETVKGGVGTYLTILSKMPGADLEQTFIVPSFHRDQMPADDARVISYPQQARGLRGIWQLASSIRSNIKLRQPDILFLHSSFSLAALLILRIFGTRIPVIYCAHGWAVSRYDSRTWQARMTAMIEGWLVGLADKTICISEYERQIAQDLGYRGKFTLLENAVPDRKKSVTNSLFEAEPHTLNILFVGRLDRQKGYDILFPAFEKAYAARPHLRLHIVGESVRQDQKEISSLQGVNFVGWIQNDQLDDWYSSADVLVVPSRWEGFGLVVAEAFRNGTPVVGSDRGALPTLITHGETGYIFSLDEAVLAQLLQTIDKKDLHGMRDKCMQAYKQRFSIDNFYQNLSLLYQSMQGSTK